MNEKQATLTIMYRNPFTVEDWPIEIKPNSIYEVQPVTGREITSIRITFEADHDG